MLEGMCSTACAGRSGGGEEQDATGRLAPSSEPFPISIIQPGGALPEPRAPRYETLTAWRGLACLSVVIFHSVCTGYGLAFPSGTEGVGWVVAIIQRLWIGVPLFFVISGYCVTASADASRRLPGSGRQFFWRRFRRIFPPFWVWFGVTVVAVVVVERVAPGFFRQVYVPNPAGFTFWQWLGNLTLTETWRWHVTGGVEMTLISPSWTLCYEEQFYALVGLTLVFARRHFFGVLTGISVVVLAGVWVLPEVGFPVMGTFLDGKWLMFAAGVLVYYVVNYVPAKRVAWFCAPLILGLVYSAAPLGNLLSARVNEPNQSYFCAFGFALVLVWLHRFDNTTARARVLRPLVFCGEMCYSLYLIHWPAVTVVSWAFSELKLNNPVLVLVLGVTICVSVAIIIARVFHHLVERRFWNQKV